MSDLDPLDDDGREFDLRRRLKECDAKLARYRELLEVDSEITSAATWIAEVERERRSIERVLGRKPTSRKHTKNEIKTLVRQLKDIVGALANADPKDKRAIYDELGVSLTYHRDGRVHVAAGAHVLRDGVGGATCRLALRRSSHAHGLVHDMSGPQAKKSALLEVPRERRRGPTTTCPERIAHSTMTP